jgi:hypothetical protein
MGMLDLIHPMGQYVPRGLPVQLVVVIMICVPLVCVVWMTFARMRFQGFVLVFQLTVVKCM